MKHFAIYETESGNIVCTYTGNQDGAALQCQDGQDYIEINEVHENHYISNGQLIQYTEGQKAKKGEFKGAGWEWSNDAMDWLLTDQAMANEFSLIMLRIKRDELLAKSDYTQMPDVPLSSKELWDNYRQALRDLPQTCADITSLDEVTWPAPPEE